MTHIEKTLVEIVTDDYFRELRHLPDMQQP